VLAFNADGLARAAEYGLLATGIYVSVTKFVGFIRCLEGQVEDPLWDLIKRVLRTHHVHMLAAGLGILSITTWRTGSAGKKVREALTHACCTGVVKIVTIAYLHVEDNSPAQLEASNDSSVCFFTGIGSILTRITAGDEHLVFIVVLPLLALPALAVRCVSVRLKTIARKILVVVLKLYTAVSLWWGDVDAWHAVYMLPLRVETICAQLLGVHIVWELAFAVLFGTPRLERNNRFCKVNRPVGRLQHRAPLFILNAAVYNEPLEIIERTIDDLTRLADAYSGQAIIVIHDDYLGLLPDQDERVAQRATLYARKGVAYTVRGEGGRDLPFAKAPNVNIGMGFFVELLGRGKLGRNTNETNNVRSLLARVRSLRARVNCLHAHPIFASFQAHIPEHVARKLASLDQDGIDSILTMQFDADTRIREDADADCLRLFAREFERNQKVGLLQIMTLGHATEPTFWPRYAVDNTNYLNGVAMPAGSSSGCPGPCVGHEIVILLKDLIEVARGRGRDANYGGLEIWSELTSGEDFEMWLQLVAPKAGNKAGKDSVYIMYAPIFEEHVTSDVHKEIGTLRKHMWSNLSLVFNSCDVRKRTGAVFTPELSKYLWPLHSTNSPCYAKILTVGYLSIYITMASSLFKVALSLIVHDSVLPTDALKPYFLAPHDGLVTVFLLFGIFATLALQFIKRVHIANTLRKTDARAAIDMIVAPGLDGFIREVFGNGLISLLFWGGLHVDLLDVLGSYLRCKKVKFTPTHAAAAEIAGENFLSAATRVLSGYRHRMLVLGTYLGVLVVLSMIGVLAPTKNMLPAVLLVLIPPVRLLLLDPSVLLATWRTLKETLQQGQQQIEALQQQVAAHEERLQALPATQPQVPAPAPLPAPLPQPGPENARTNLQRVRERMAVWGAAQQWVVQAEEVELDV